MEWFLPEKYFFVRIVTVSKQELFNALQEIAAMKLYAFSIRTGSHRVHIQMCVLSLSHGPIHLSSLESLLCPSPFLQLLIHLPLATQQPPVVSHCWWVALGREDSSFQISHRNREKSTRAASVSVQGSSGAVCFLYNTPGATLPPVRVRGHPVCLW